MNFVLNDQSQLKLQFRRSRKARRIRLQVSPDGVFTLVAPWLTPEKSIQRFITVHTKWIEKQLAKINQQKEFRPEFSYHSGDQFYYFGEAVTLKVIPSSRKRPVVKIRENELRVELDKTVGEQMGKQLIRKAIEAFYRKKAEEVIHDRLQYFNEFYGFYYNRVTLRNQKSRWGSCSRLKNLNFNWRLIMAPIEVIDYVVAHELCHLKEMNHSSRFWALVEKTLPDHKVYRKWFKENHYLLTYLSLSSAISIV